MNIIDGLQKKHFKFLERLITIIGWLLALGYMFQIILCLLLWFFNLSNFYRKLFVLGSIKATLITMVITVIISISSFMILYLWSFYNYKRFAHLRRRKFPREVTVEDITDYFHLEPNLVIKMQGEKIIELDKTIV
jgi:poly-beta-1,6-N-acetyl-D-glucosamine biosynthesis protein PgaD